MMYARTTTWCGRFWLATTRTPDHTRCSRSQATSKVIASAVAFFVACFPALRKRAPRGTLFPGWRTRYFCFSSSSLIWRWISRNEPLWLLLESFVRWRWGGTPLPFLPCLSSLGGRRFSLLPRSRLCAIGTSLRARVALGSGSALLFVQRSAPSEPLSASLYTILP